MHVPIPTALIHSIVNGRKHYIVIIIDFKVGPLASSDSEFSF
jgi:hypothetical protein